MKKSLLTVFAAVGLLTSGTAHAFGEDCFGNYLRDLNACGNNTACAANALGTYLLCLEENGQGPCANGGCLT